jgi:hypothetical protein
VHQFLGSEIPNLTLLIFGGIHMAEFFGVLVLILLLWFAFKTMAGGYSAGRSGADSPEASRPRRPAPTDQDVLNANMGWLRERWNAVDAAKAAGKFDVFPKWFFDQVTERQLTRLQKMGVRVTAGELSKGTASDIIGLFEPMEDHTKDILKFFKVQLPRENQNESRARFEVAKLLSDLANAQAWEQRSADAMQKEFLRHFGAKVPAKLRHEQASTLIREIREQKTAAEIDEWNDFESLCDELSDPEALRDYDLII